VSITARLSRAHLLTFHQIRFQMTNELIPLKRTRKPKVNSEGEKQLIKIEEQSKAFEQNVKDLTLDRMNMAPKKEEEQQTKLSTQEALNSKDIYLKPKRSIGCRDKFNEKYRASYEFAKQYVQFIAENKEIIGESIDLWTRPYAGMPAEEWEVPCNKPVWGPRYLAEQIKRKFYHRLVMQATPTGSDQMGQYYGSMAADTTIQRLDAIPVNRNKSLFFSA
jgi:hypothetical protein